MTNPLSFNITNSDGTLLCPVCGFPNFSKSPAYAENGGEIGTTICPCCLWEPGFDDQPAASMRAKATIKESILSYRKRWAVTKQWQGQVSKRPPDFDSSEQLAELLRIAPDF